MGINSSTECCECCFAGLTSIYSCIFYQIGSFLLGCSNLQVWQFLELSWFKWYPNSTYTVRFGRKNGDSFVIKVTSLKQQLCSFVYYLLRISYELTILLFNSNAVENFSNQAFFNLIQYHSSNFRVKSCTGNKRKYNGNMLRFSFVKINFFVRCIFLEVEFLVWR